MFGASFKFLYCRKKVVGVIRLTYPDVCSDEDRRKTIAERSIAMVTEDNVLIPKKDLV